MAKQSKSSARGQSSYAEKLRDPRWQKRRLEILSRDGWQCQHCGCKDETLHIHHYWYERGQQPWEAIDDALVTLCESCHAVETETGLCGVKSLAQLFVRGKIPMTHARELISEIGECFDLAVRQDLTKKDVRTLAFAIAHGLLRQRETDWLVKDYESHNSFAHRVLGQGDDDGAD